MNSKTLDMAPTLEEVVDDITTKGLTDMTTTTKDDDDKRLTPTQKEIRDRCGNVPRHIRRSIDAYRVARGMVPLWGSSPERGRRTR